MSFEVHCRIHDETLEANLRKRIDGFKKKMLTPEVKRKAAEIYGDCIEYYVPESGRVGKTLRKSANVQKYKGTYAVVYEPEDEWGRGYAKAQYEGENGTDVPESDWNRANPHTYSHWNQHLTSADRNAMWELIKEMVLEEIKHG